MPRTRRRLPPVSGAADRGRASRATCASTPGSQPGTEVTPAYDPLLAKLIVLGAARAEAVDALAAGARADAHRRDRDQPRATCARRWRTRAIASGDATRPRRSRRVVDPTPRIDVLRGRHDDHRAGLSGPPRLLGRRRAAVGPDGRSRASGSATARSATPRARAGLECTLDGPALRFSRRPSSALTGAPGRARRSTASRRRCGSRSTVPAGATLDVGRVEARAARLHLRSRAASTCPTYLGSRGDLHARRLRRPRRPGAAPGDVLRLGAEPAGTGGRCAGAVDARPPLRDRVGARRPRRAACRARLLHRARTSRRSTRPTGRSTTTQPAPACA